MAQNPYSGGYDPQNGQGYGQYPQYQPNYAQYPDAQNQYYQPTTNVQYPQQQQPYQYPQQGDISQQSIYTPPPATERPVSYQQQDYSNYEYNYDPKNIHYTQMSVDQWSQIQNDPSPYSQYWDSPQAFEPSTFAHNTQEQHGWNDKGWAIAFWIHFIITIAIFAWLVYDGYNHDVFKQDDQGVDYKYEIPWGFLGKILGVGFVVALVVNILHGVYASVCPVLYIKIGFWVGFILSVIFGVIAILVSSIMWVIFPILSLLLTICYYCIIKKYIRFSAAVFSQSLAIIRRHPTIILFTIVEMLFNSVISVIFSYMIFMVDQLGYTPVLYLYIVLSFLWTNITFGYVTYLTGAGLAAQWYFLDGLPDYPQHAVWSSFKRACTTSFGSASVAGFLLACVKFARFILSLMADNNDNVICCIIICILQCILSVIEWFVTWMNKYGLIYCAIFGVPYKEGCRRFQELSCKRFSDLILRGCCISNAITYNMFVFVVCAAALGYAFGYLVFKDTTYGSLSADDTEFLGKVFTCAIATVFAYTMFEILSEPLDVIPDTILVCFAENPERLHTTASDLYDEIVKLYKDQVNDVLQNS